MEHVNDFSSLNAKTNTMKWLLPLIQHAIEDLSNSKWYTKIDLSDAFFRIPLKPEHREFTVLNTGTRQVQYTVMPMGLCNSTATFQRCMTSLFKDVDYAKPSVDNLILPGGSFQQILKHTEFVFKRLISAGLKMGGKKNSNWVT